MTKLRRQLHFIYAVIFFAASTYCVLGGVLLDGWGVPLFLSYGIVCFSLSVYCVRIALGRVEPQSSLPKSLRNTFVIFMVGAQVAGLISRYYILTSEGSGPVNLALIMDDLPLTLFVILVLDSVIFVSVVFPIWAIFHWLRRLSVNRNILEVSGCCPSI